MPVKPPVKPKDARIKVKVFYLDNRPDYGMPSIAGYIDKEYLEYRKIGDKGIIIRMEIISGKDVAFVRNKEGIVSAYLAIEIGGTG